MIDDLVIGVATGALAGVIFFGGLHWTVSRLPGARRPAALAVVSLGVRIAIVAALFLLLIDGSLVRALAGLAGLVLIRSVIVLAVRRARDPARESTWN